MLVKTLICPYMVLLRIKLKADSIVSMLDKFILRVKDLYESISFCRGKVYSYANM